MEENCTARRNKLSGHTVQSWIEPMPKSSAAVDLEALRWTYAFELVSGSKVKLASLTVSEGT
jgi:hypothetical protein